MKTSIIKTALTGIILLLQALTASAYDFKVGGLAYNYLNGSSGNEVEVTYIDYISTSNYSGLTTANIPSSVTYNGKTYSVTSIGDNAFRYSTGLTSVTIPNSVTTIGYSAFYYCSGLTSVTIPNSVTSIGGYAFSGCSGLTSVTFPNSVTSIGDHAFQYCSGLTSVTIPNSVTSIGGSAFDGTPWYNNQPDGLVYAGLVAYKYKGTMPANTSITLRDGTKGIADEAFYHCKGLTSVTIPNSVTSIGNYAFGGCSGLTSVSIPNSVISIDQQAFRSCSGLTSVSIPNSVTSIGNEAFRSCSGLTSVTIGNSVTSIGSGAFALCSGLTSMKVVSGNTKYDSRNNCNAIIETATNTLISGCKTTTIPASVTSIGNYAFWGCYNLTSVTIPNSVTSIGRSAFNGCSGLTEISSKIVNVSGVSMGSYIFDGVPKSSTSCVLKVPVGTATAYRNAGQWRDFSNIQDVFLVDSGTIGDLNCDHVVDGEDLNIMVNMLLKNSTYLDIDNVADLSGDGRTNGFDVNDMISIILGE